MERNSHRDSWLVIGISGVTCGGKTTLANKLLNTISCAHVLHQDKYFLADTHPAHTPVPGLNHHNYDILSALDMAQMHRDALSILSGKTDVAHNCSPATGPGMLAVHGKRVLIIEGFTVLNYRPLYELCDLRYYLVLEYGECVSRRTHRLYDPPDVAGYFERCVWPEHQRYRAELQNDPAVSFLDGTDPTIMERVINDLRGMGAHELSHTDCRKGTNLCAAS